MTCAVTAFIAINFFAPKEYYKSIFWPDVPVFLKAPLPIMPVIEFIGVFTKPFSLTVRLFANIMAGHIIILALTSVVFITAEMGAGLCASMTVVSVLFCIFMNCLELLVAFIQAYVFTILTANFIGLAHNE
jgi:F-type H+-transporting ATPase subunit a